MLPSGKKFILNENIRSNMIKIYEVMLDLFVKTELCCHFKCVVQWN